jgi:CRISPR-associated endoribonuclease Cas6
MRIHLRILSNNCIIPFSHQHLLVGTIHKWLGWNDLHGGLSLFSFSRIEKCKANNKGLQLENYSSMFISAFDDEVIKQLISGIQNDQTMFSGLSVTDIMLEEDPDLSTRDHFYVASPILIKRPDGERINHFRFDNEQSNELLKETLVNKMNKAGIVDETFEIQFDKNYPAAKTMLIDYNGIQNRANWCHVIIKGKPETKLFAWNVGLGNSTGIGFGAVR